MVKGQKEPFSIPSRRDPLSICLPNEHLLMFLPNQQVSICRLNRKMISLPITLRKAMSSSIVRSTLPMTKGITCRWIGPCSIGADSVGRAIVVQVSPEILNIVVQEVPSMLVDIPLSTANESFLVTIQHVNTRGSSAQMTTFNVQSGTIPVRRERN